MLLINVTLVANPGQNESFKTLLLDTMAASKTEPGCIEYRYTADLVETDTFHLIELWQDEAALQEHFKGAAFRHFIATLSTLGKVMSSVARSGDLAPHIIQR